jgi:hypothetical protein
MMITRITFDEPQSIAPSDSASTSAETTKLNLEHKLHNAVQPACQPGQAQPLPAALKIQNSEWCEEYFYGARQIYIKMKAANRTV